MSSKVFVGGLHWRTTEPSLKEAFAKLGEVENVRIIVDRETGRSRCFGFVFFNDEETAEKALALNERMQLDGRVLKISRAKEREPRLTLNPQPSALETSLPA